MYQNDLFKLKYKLTLNEYEYTPNQTAPKAVLKVIRRGNNFQEMVELKDTILYNIKHQTLAESGNPFHFVYVLKINKRTSIKYEETFDLKDRLIL